VIKDVPNGLGKEQKHNVESVVTRDHGGNGQYVVKFFVDCTAIIILLLTDFSRLEPCEIS
jgi:hypothetical protein